VDSLELLDTANSLTSFHRTSSTFIEKKGPSAISYSIMTSIRQNGSSGTPSLSVFAKDIAAKVEDIAKFLKANNLPEPSLAPGTPNVPSGEEYSKLYKSLKVSLEDLDHFVSGPRQYWRATLVRGYEIAALQVALDFEFFSLVPLDGEISLQNLAKKADLDLDRTSRIIRLLATHSIFKEGEPGYISHSALSHVLHTDEELRCTVHYS
jgi:hypothetical protein